MQIYSAGDPCWYWNQHKDSRRHSGLVITKFDDLKLICAKSISHMQVISESRICLICFKNKFETIWLNHIALWFHSWKWESQSNCSLLQFIFSSISPWRIRISRVRGSLQRLSNQSICIHYDLSTLKNFKPTVKIFCKGDTTPSWNKVPHNTFFSQSNHNIKQKTFLSLLNAMCPFHTWFIYSHGLSSQGHWSYMVY